MRLQIERRANHQLTGRADRETCDEDEDAKFSRRTFSAAPEEISSNGEAQLTVFLSRSIDAFPEEVIDSQRKEEYLMPEPS